MAKRKDRAGINNKKYLSFVLIDISLRFTRLFTRLLSKCNGFRLILYVIFIELLEKLVYRSGLLPPCFDTLLICFSFLKFNVVYLLARVKADQISLRTYSFPE